MIYLLGNVVGFYMHGTNMSSISTVINTDYTETVGHTLKTFAGLCSETWYVAYHNIYTNNTIYRV